MNFDRKDKNYYNRLVKHSRYGMYVIDCRYHPCKVTAVEFDKFNKFGTGIDCKSLITNTNNNCSLLNCGIEPISENKAKEMAEFAKSNDWFEYLKKYCGFSEEEREHYGKIEKEWNFETNK